MAGAEIKGETSMTHDEKLQVIQVMRAHGGSFVRQLAEAWLYADADNCRRIEMAFPEYVEKYRAIAAEMMKEQA